MTKRRDITLQLLAAYGVSPSLERAPAVVLERVARGGGETAWFYCRSERDLAYIVDRLRPGSVVSFYFDGRMILCPFGDLPSRSLDEIACRDGECVVGSIRENGIDIDVSFIASSAGLDDDFEGYPKDGLFIYGPFPARDCDGQAAVTFILPDDDGVFRAHPH